MASWAAVVILSVIALVLVTQITGPPIESKSENNSSSTNEGEGDKRDDLVCALFDYRLPTGKKPFVNFTQYI